MKMKLIIAGLSGVTIALGALWLSAAADGNKLAELIEQAHQRGISMTSVELALPPEVDEIIAEMESVPPWYLMPELRDVSPETEDVAEMTAIVRVTARQQELARQFSRLTFEDTGDSRVAAIMPSFAQLLQLRARLEIAEGRWQDALETSRIVKGIGSASKNDLGAHTTVVRTMYYQIIERLAAAAGGQGNLQLLLDEIDLWQPTSYRQSVVGLPARYFEDIENVAQGVTPPPATAWGPFSVSFERLPVKVTRRKIELLEAAIDFYDHWNESPTGANINQEDGDGEWSPAQLFRANASFLKRAEVNAFCAYRAARLTVASWLHRTGESWPTVMDLKALGYEVSDPLSGKPFLIRAEAGVPRVFGDSVGLRRNHDGQTAILDIYY